MAYAKVGKKSKHVELPNGWKQITGKAQMGDRFLNAPHFVQTGQVRWINITEEDLDEDNDWEFLCLIRKVKRCS